MLLSTERLSEAIGYRFEDPELLKTALTHSSYVNENKLHYNENNERLEFLGDAVLDAVISEYLYREYPEAEEGSLTKQRAAIVCEQALHLCARKLDLGQYLVLGKGEEHNGGRTRPSMNADAVEAIHKQGKKVLVWTSNEKKSQKHFLCSRIDGLITDNASQALDLIRELKERSDLQRMTDRIMELIS